MVLGAQWGEFGVWLCGELFLAAEFYEEGEVYCGVAGYDCALVYCDGDCEFGLFIFLFCFLLGQALLVHLLVIPCPNSYKSGDLTTHYLHQSTWGLRHVYPGV